jgi:hypothetical protein
LRDEARVADDLPAEDRPDADFRAPFLDPEARFTALRPLIAFVAFLVVTFTCRRTRVTVRRTARRTARRGFAVCAAAVVAALVAAVVAAAAADVAAPAAPCAPSTTMRVAVPRVLPTLSAACVRGVSSSSRCESSAIASPCRCVRAKRGPDSVKRMLAEARENGAVNVK